ncbi:hypothetical protein C1752_00103 [Acaryochloris thomasi RCC1774]|uniref:Shikimate kinase n=1 Tax=Acaryochloris thomasi RCC1774 TaxID=1764569 RepID=A0A2W1K1S0_9CYAN|nr:shikimate kinase [Acaryochloris thomasi]PZD75374.1 hypothetical protein C1752_00103 [Acaryochloris thomasi RCC1774]
MKVILLGNAGAGKSTLTQKLLEKERAAVLSLDEIVFEEKTANRRPLADSIAAAKRFIACNESWVIEGCYANILEPLLGECEQLIFLNPGVEVCLSHCRSRPWEPEKFDTAEAQSNNFENLIQWVKEYNTRQDEYGLARHQDLFNSFNGSKREFNDPSEYAAV